jgi:hypothetical protein
VIGIPTGVIEDHVDDHTTRGSSSALKTYQKLVIDAGTRRNALDDEPIPWPHSPEGFSDFAFLRRRKVHGLPRRVGAE